MWKRSEPERNGEAMMAQQPYTSMNSAQPMASTPVAAAKAVIGPTLKFKGDVSGDEDLQVLGQIEGTVSLKSSLVTVGRGGAVKGNVYARAIVIEGEIQGDLIGGEQVTVKHTGIVRGNITAPTVSLEGGAKLKGSIDMDPGAADTASANLGKNVEIELTTEKANAVVREERKSVQMEKSFN